MQSLRSCTALAVLASMTAVQPVRADHDHQHLETVEVYGQAIPATITSMNASNQAPGRETGESLRDFLGVSGARMGGHGIDPSIRGLSQTQLNVLLDGAYVHGGCPNRMDPPTSYASNYEEVTVIRGSQTLAYGGGGPGGTIVFSRRTPTVDPADPIQGSITASWRGNSNTSSLDGDVTVGGTRGYVRLIGGIADSDSYDDGNGIEVRSAWKERSGSVTLSYTPTEGTSLALSYDHQETLDALFPGAGMDSPEAINDTVRFRAEALEAGPFRNIKAELYRSDVEHLMDNYSLRNNMSLHMQAPSISETTGGRVLAEVDSELGLWKMGVDAQHNERSARRINRTMAPAMVNSILWPDVNIDQTGAFAELARSLSQEIWLLAGLRYDHVRSSAGATRVDPMGMPMSPLSLYSLYYGDVSTRSRTDHNLGGLLRIEYAPDQSRSRWYAGIARSVRTPDASERYLAANGMMPGQRWVGNPNLEPEVHQQFELGGLSSWGSARVEMSLFYNRVNDYILRDRFGAQGNHAAIYRSIDARLMGGEARIKLQLSDIWRAELGLAYVHGTNLSDDRPIAQIQPLESYAQLSWQRDNWTLEAIWQGAARQPRVDLTSSTGIEGQGLDLRSTPGWGILNLLARWNVSQSLRIEAGVDNILDRGYAQHMNRGNAFDPTQIQVNEPGRSLWASVSLAF